MPYWTTDIGGFFRPGRGQYTDTKYHDILTRWFQWGTFNPIFRVHAYQTETEPWKYGDTVMNNMRLWDKYHGQNKYNSLYGEKMNIVKR